jgi:hypothetical protein
MPEKKSIQRHKYAHLNEKKQIQQLHLRMTLKFQEHYEKKLIQLSRREICVSNFLPPCEKVLPYFN